VNTDKNQWKKDAPKQGAAAKKTESENGEKHRKQLYTSANREHIRYIAMLLIGWLIGRVNRNGKGHENDAPLTNMAGDLG
jgi:hypothetical protein